MTSLISGLQTAKLEANNLPYDLSISTATITCKINVMFDVSNIAYYFNDFDDIIIGKKYGNRVVNNLINFKKIKTGKKKKRKEKKNFFNQVSLIFRTATLMGIDPEKLSLKEKFKNINVKLFINGSIQMTGCKHLDNIRKCLEILFEKLKVTKAILNDDFKFEKKTFIKSIDNLDLSKIKIVKKKIFIDKNHKNFNQYLDTISEHDDDDEHDKILSDIYSNDDEIECIEDSDDKNTDLDLDFNLNQTINDISIKPTNDTFDKEFLNINNIYMFAIRMINTNFNIGFQINREKLYQLLIENGFDVSFDPIVHACVNIKYTISELNKTVSIFVFESGSITIAGSNSCEQILYTYNFINKFILSNYLKLLSKPITPQLIIQLIKNMK